MRGLALSNFRGAPQAESYELVVYRVGEEREEARPVLRETFAGSAFSWTPSLNRCLERGGQYAWSVRAAGEKAASDWSAPSLFAVASGPSEVDFEEALAVVRQYLATQGGPESNEAEVGAEAEPESDDEGSESSPTRRAIGTTQLTVDGGVEAVSFTGDGSTLTSLDPANLSAGEAGIDISGTAASASASASDVACAGCVAESELDFDPATQTELDVVAADGIYLAGNALELNADTFDVVGSPVGNLWA